MRYDDSDHRAFSSRGGLRFAMKFLSLSLWWMDPRVHAVYAVSQGKGDREEINDAVKRMIYTRLRKFKCFLQDVQDVHSGGGCLISIRTPSSSSSTAAALTCAWLFISCTRSTLAPIYIHCAPCSLLSDRATHGVNVTLPEWEGKRRKEEKKEESEKGKKKKSTELGLNGGKTGN